MHDMYMMREKLARIQTQASVRRMAEIISEDDCLICTKSKLQLVVLSEYWIDKLGMSEKLEQYKEYVDLNIDYLWDSYYKLAWEG
jgi:hypothetical protein